MRSESGLLYIEASADGQIEKIMGDASWLPRPLKAYETRVSDVFPALEGVNGQSRLELDFVELAPEVFADIQYQSHDGRLYVWLRNTSRHAEHLRAAQQVANSRALKEAVATRWMDDIRRDSSHLRMVLNTLPMPIGYWSRAGELLFGNTMFLQLSGQSTPTDRALVPSHATASNAGAMSIPAAVWEQAQSLPGLGAVTFSRVGVPGGASCKLVADLSPAGEVTGLIDITELVIAH
jgi:PAS domain-containing protein